MINMFSRSAINHFSKYIVTKILSSYDYAFSLKKYDSFILVYHMVANEKQGANLRNNSSTYNVSLDVFEEHLTYLISH